MRKGMCYQPYTSRYWNDYFGYTSKGKSGSNEAISSIQKTRSYETFKTEHALFLENIKSEDQKALIEQEKSPAPIESVKAVAASENHSIKSGKLQDERSPVDIKNFKSEPSPSRAPIETSAEPS